MKYQFKRGMSIKGAVLLEPTKVKLRTRIAPAWVCRVHNEVIEIISEHNLKRRAGTKPTPLMAGRNRIFSGYRDRCRIRNIYFDLTVEEFAVLTQQPCAYCHCEPRGKESVSGWRYNGLDRKENAQGYVPGNVVPACGFCNSVKSDKLTHREMKAAMAAILKVRGKKKG